jgi:hypothetical protein
MSTTPHKVRHSTPGLRSGPARSGDAGTSSSGSSDNRRRASRSPAMRPAGTPAQGCRIRERAAAGDRDPGPHGRTTMTERRVGSLWPISGTRIFAGPGRGQRPPTTPPRASAAVRALGLSRSGSATFLFRSTAKLMSDFLAGGRTASCRLHHGNRLVEPWAQPHPPALRSEPGHKAGEHAPRHDWVCVAPSAGSLAVWTSSASIRVRRDPPTRATARRGVHAAPGRLTRRVELRTPWPTWWGAGCAPVVPLGQPGGSLGVA